MPANVCSSGVFLPLIVIILIKQNCFAQAVTEILYNFQFIGCKDEGSHTLGIIYNNRLTHVVCKTPVSVGFATQTGYANSSMQVYLPIFGFDKMPEHTFITFFCK